MFPDPERPPLLRTIRPTDDSEMALAVARTMVEWGTQDPDAARAADVDWLASGPFDWRNTLPGALRGHRRPDSQAYGARVRIRPLGISGLNPWTAPGFPET